MTRAKRGLIAGPRDFDTALSRKHRVCPRVGSFAICPATPISGANREMATLPRP